MDEFFSVNLPFPLPDALQEFSVETSNYAAQYGSNSGGVVNIITKSGTNSIHGDLFEFDRNAVFNARNFFAGTRDQLKRNQFGFTLGGPVVIPKLYNGRDRTFWFFGYQSTRLRNIGNTSSAFVPTPEELNGDFSAYLSANNPNNPLGKASQIIDPLTGQPFPEISFRPAGSIRPHSAPRSSCPRQQARGRCSIRVESSRIWMRRWSGSITRSATRTG